MTIGEYFFNLIVLIEFSYVSFTAFIFTGFSFYFLPKNQISARVDLCMHLTLCIIPMEYLSQIANAQIKPSCSDANIRDTHVNTRVYTPLWKLRFE